MTVFVGVPVLTVVAEPASDVNHLRRVEVAPQELPTGGRLMPMIQEQAVLPPGLFDGAREALDFSDGVSVALLALVVDAVSQITRPGKSEELHRERGIDHAVAPFAHPGREARRHADAARTGAVRDIVGGGDLKDEVRLEFAQLSAHIGRLVGKGPARYADVQHFDGPIEVGGSLGKPAFQMGIHAILGADAPSKDKGVAENDHAHGPDRFWQSIVALADAETVG